MCAPLLAVEAYTGKWLRNEAKSAVPSSAFQSDCLFSFRCRGFAMILRSGQRKVRRSEARIRSACCFVSVVKASSILRDLVAAVVAIAARSIVLALRNVRLIPRSIAVCKARVSVFLKGFSGDVATGGIGRAEIASSGEWRAGSMAIKRSKPPGDGD